MKDLPPRLLQVAYLIHQEKTAKEIAVALDLSVLTTKMYTTNIKNKLGCRTRVGIALWYERNHYAPATSLLQK